MNDRQASQQITVAQRVDNFVGQIMTRDRRDAVLASLPAHVKPERFERNLVVAVQNHPKLLNCDAQLVFNEVAKAAALGLYLDPALGEAYLITGWSGALRCEVPQLRMGYRGLIKLGRQSGEIATVYAHEVCANDRFQALLGTEKQLVHEPDYMRDRGPVVMYYAVVKYRDGVTVDFEPMSIEAIHEIRDRSDGYRAFMDGKIKSTPWATDEGEMAKKTVLRRLMKRLPQSPEIGEALRIEDEDFREPVAIERPSLRKRLTAAPTASAGFNRARVDREIEGEYEHADPPMAADEPPVVKVIETPPEPEPPPTDVLSVETASLDEAGRMAWVEAFRAKALAAKSTAAFMDVWRAHFDQITAIKAADEALFDRLEKWFGERLKKLREREQQ